MESALPADTVPTFRSRRRGVGLQVAFVATVPKEFLAERTTPWILKSVRWRDGHE